MKERTTTGIYVSRVTQLHSRRGNAGENQVIILRCVYFYLCLAGTVLTLREATGVKFRTAVVLGGLFLCCLLLAVRQMKGWERIPGAAGGFPLFVLLGGSLCVFWGRERLVSGYLVVENGIRRQLQEYYGITVAQKAVPIPEEKGEFFLIFLFALLVIGLGNLVVRRGRIAFLILVQVLILALELLCGSRFQEPGFYLVIGGIFALAAMGNRRGGRNRGMLLQTGMYAGILLLLLLLFCAEVLAPRLYEKALPWNEKLYTTVQETLGKINTVANSQNGLFGNHTPTADGSLNNYQVRQDEKTDLRVTVTEKPESSIYLRGFIGDTYEGTYWHGADEMQFAEAFPERNAEYQVQNLLYHYISSRADTDPGTIRVERVRPGGEYGYVPYGYETPNDRNLIGDSRYDSAENQMDYKGYVNWKRWMDNAAAENSSEMEKKYQQYAADQYLKVPVEGLERLKEYCAQYNFQSVQEVIDFVVPAVQEGRPYSMDLRPVPAGKDFAEYFFFDQKKGYCIHYATTAVLMFRLMGVPARYVTGYMVPPDLFVQNSVGYQAAVPDSQAHAWVEVYRSGKGWIPIEVTPGYGIDENVMLGDTSENTAHNTVTPEPTETETVTPEPTGTETVTPKPTGAETVTPEPTEVEAPTSEAIRIFSVIGKMFLILAGMGILAFLGMVGARWNRKRILKNRKRQFFQKDRNQGAQEVSYQLYQMLWDAGIKAEESYGKTPDISYARQMERQLEGLKEGEYVRFIRLVEKAAYGREKISREELQDCVNFYHRIAAQLWEKMDSRKKLWWKYMKCYEIS